MGLHGSPEPLQTWELPGISKVSRISSGNDLLEKFNLVFSENCCHTYHTQH